MARSETDIGKSKPAKETEGECPSDPQGMDNLPSLTFCGGRHAAYPSSALAGYGHLPILIIVCGNLVGVNRHKTLDKFGVSLRGRPSTQLLLLDHRSPSQRDRGEQYVSAGELWPVVVGVGKKKHSVTGWKITPALGKVMRCQADLSHRYSTASGITLHSSH
jgi:hypothetical protein